MTSGNSENRHCSVVSVAGAGVLIEGVAGSGKTSLALGIVDTALARGLDAALVSDDQALCRKEAGGLVAAAPPSIAGLAEIRGFGVARMPFLPCCRIALIGRLVDDAEVARLPEAERETVMGVELPLLRLPERHEQQSARIILAWLAEHRPSSPDECPKPGIGNAGSFFLHRNQIPPR